MLACSVSPTTEIVTFLGSMLPIIELRGSIPFGIGCGLHPLTVFILSVLGNFLITIPILFLLPLLEKIFRKIHPTFNQFADWIFNKTQAKHSKKMATYGHIALIAIVAIPLPGTGAWTGSLISYLSGIPKKDAFLYIFIGVFLAGTIMTAVSLGFLNLFTA